MLSVKWEKVKLQNIEISILDCGVPNKKPSRIVGGYETQIGEYPWQVCESVFSRLLLIWFGTFVSKEDSNIHSLLYGLEQVYVNRNT